MTVLVAAASRHGATQEIAEAIGRTLRASGVDAVTWPVADVDQVGSYEACVLGSAVYAGRWLEPARHFVDRHAAELSGMPTWLFSSGPIGDPPRPDAADAVHVDELVAATAAREHRLFAGKLDKSELGFGERAIVVAFRAAAGDFRDWDAIESWGAAIAAALRPGTAADGSAAGR